MNEKQRQSGAREWKPFSPYMGMGRPAVVDRVTLLRSGTIKLSDDIVERLGNPSKIQLLVDGTAHQFAIGRAASPVGSASLSRTGRQCEFRVWRLLRALNKDTSQMDWPLDLPHSWDGDLLVVDVSEVPSAAETPV